MYLFDSNQEYIYSCSFSNHAKKKKRKQISKLKHFQSAVFTIYRDVKKQYLQECILSLKLLKGMVHLLTDILKIILSLQLFKQ